MAESASPASCCKEWLLASFHIPCLIWSCHALCSIPVLRRWILSADVEEAACEGTGRPNSTFAGLQASFQIFWVVNSNTITTVGGPLSAGMRLAPWACVIIYLSHYLTRQPSLRTARHRFQQNAGCKQMKKGKLRRFLTSRCKEDLWLEPVSSGSLAVTITQSSLGLNRLPYTLT